MSAGVAEPPVVGQQPDARASRQPPRGDAESRPAANAPNGRGVRAAARVVGLTLAAAGVLSSPLWGRHALAQLDFFRVRRVEVEGARLAAPADIVARLRADTTASVWDDLAPYTARVRAHPLVADASVARRLPGVLVVRVREKQPVAMAPGAAGVVYYDTAGRALPVAPGAAAAVDVPLVAAPDAALLRALGALRTGAPALFARVSEARAVGGRAAELVFALAGDPGAPPAPAAPATLVRAAPNVTPARFAEVVAVERDLARRGVRPDELDLRFRDQVVARLP